jgi:DNA repair and recombination RAD54-like protein
MVKRLNNKTTKQADLFVFLLSKEAGSCGLNLIGANHIVLFEPSWNPATDKQSSARIWRDGQQKQCNIYRLLTANSIDEKVFQRQLSKEGLQHLLGDQCKLESQVSEDDFKNLFNHNSQGTLCDTHDKSQCPRCDSQTASVPQLLSPDVSDMNTWSHNSSSVTTNSDTLKLANHDLVTFIYSLTAGGANNRFVIYIHKSSSV